MSNRAKATILLVVVNFFWGLSYIFMKMGLDSLQTFNLVALRCIIAFLIAGLIFYKYLLRISIQAVLASTVLGFLLFTVFSFVTFGLSMTKASNAGFLLSLTVVFVPVIQSILLKSLPSLPIRIGLLLTITGIGFMTLNSTLSLNPGDVLCVISALAYAIHILVIEKVTKKHEAIAIGVLQLGIAGFIAFIFSLIFETPSLPSNYDAWIAILGLAILCSAFGFVCQAVAQKHTTPTQTGLMFSLEPIFAAMLAVIILGESLSIKDFTGASIIIIGVLVATLANNRTEISLPNETSINEKYQVSKNENGSV
ncbi:DMT family transporter [Cytobacillus purgationiresistens]|uniref:Drug/metabolite transporter (DMT)-like permease n=1 Tax=Cytobacillus purgationiresistens TaxID=863449 RepID=A0ABU0AAN8_9BACI|nr:DMT family transporter [Cytobacillus purgationiresistens]MDQ0268315.1 drug/metabolite transporter (DMT)-like permease [Cytobacillus purgationiresistens]